MSDIEKEDPLLINESSVSLKPGRVLQSLRLEKGLSLEDIHSLTMIGLPKLVFIESDDYSQFDSPVFISGYIRSYAKAVDANADELILEYQRLTDTAVVDSELPAVAHKNVLKNMGSASLNSPAFSFFRRFSFITIVISLVIVWIVGSFLFANRSDKKSTPDHNDVSLGVTANDFDTANVRGELNNGLALMAPSSETVEVVLPKPIVSNEHVALDESKPTASSEAATPSDVIETNTPIESLPSVLEQPVVQTDDMGDLTQSVLEFSFMDDCWVEVSDARGESTFAELKNKGDNLRLFGLGPFDIMLGNARAVELTLNGDPVQLQLTGGRKTLRFTLDVAE